MNQTGTPTFIVLAAQRAGVVNPLAERAGVSHKCIVPICGEVLIRRVLDVIASLPGGARVRISVEAEMHDELAALLADYAGRGLDVSFTASSPNLAESVLTACADGEGPFIVTTADNVLMSRESIEATIELMRSADAAAVLAPEAAVKAVRADAQRKFYQFRDGGYANCNLYALSGRKALGAVEIFREGGQFMKNPKRLIAAFGLINILLVRFGLVSLDRAMKLASRRFGMTIRALVTQDGTQAVDVDNERTYEIVEMVLARRSG